MARNIQEWATQVLLKAERDGPPPEGDREKEALLRAIPGLREQKPGVFVNYRRELSSGEHLMIRQYLRRRKDRERQGEEFQRVLAEGG